MSASAAKRWPPLSKVVNTNKVISTVFVASLSVYMAFEVQMRAAAKAGKVPRTRTDVRTYFPTRLVSSM